MNAKLARKIMEESKNKIVYPPKHIIDIIDQRIEEAAQKGKNSLDIYSHTQEESCGIRHWYADRGFSIIERDNVPSSLYIVEIYW